MMRRVLSLAALALLAVSATASAQRTRTTMPVKTAAPHHDGFMMGFGLGSGSAGVSCTGCETDRENGLSGYLQMGTAISPNLVLSAELNGWQKDKNGASSRIGFLTGSAQWYPSSSNAFFVKTGMGVGQIKLEDKTTVPSDKIESMGFAYQFGAGYDFRMTNSFALTPYASYMATTGATAKLNGTSTNEKLNTNNLQIGVGLTWH